MTKVNVVAMYAKLLEAITKNEISIIEETLSNDEASRKSYLDHQDKESGNTLLHMAVIHDNMYAAFILLHYGADMGIKNHLGFTAQSLYERINNLY